MAKTYEIRTLKDIFDKVPADRWDTLFAEIQAMFRQADAMRDITNLIGESIGVDEPGEFDELIIWKDDGNGDLMTVLCAEGIVDVSITTKL